jgi:hypothetical protein
MTDNGLNTRKYLNIFSLSGLAASCFVIAGASRFLEL